MDSMAKRPELTDPPEDEEPSVSFQRALERLRAITFLGPNDPPPRYRPLEWDPDPSVRVQRALARLRAIKF
jgi:hypothetical protein